MNVRTIFAISLRRLGSAILASAVLWASLSPAQDSTGPAAWPEQDLARFVFEHLDISSFRNSTGPKRAIGQRFLRDIGIVPTSVSNSEATSDDGNWLYTVRILGRSDYNKDGMEEVLVCFIDSAQNGGTYSAVNHYVLQLIDGRAIALATTQDSRAEDAGCASSR